MLRWTLLAALFAGGCYNETKFVPAKTAAFCSLLLECTDPAVLAFDGIDADTCEGVWGPVFRGEGAGCKLNRGDAKDCVQALENATCPADGESVADAIPSICDTAWKKCEALPTPADTDPPEDTDPPADTDAPE